MNTEPGNSELEDLLDRLSPEWCAAMVNAFSRMNDVEQQDREQWKRDLLTAHELETAMPEILAALRAVGNNEPSSDVERVSLIDAFEIGFVWRGHLIGQTLEDARAVSRTLGSDVFAPIMPQIEAAEKTIGFNAKSVDNADLGICAAKKIIHHALASLQSPQPTEGGEIEIREIDDLDQAVRRFHFEAFLAGVCYERDEWPTTDEEWANVRGSIQSEAVGEHYDGWLPDLETALNAALRPAQSGDAGEKP